MISGQLIQAANRVVARVRQSRLYLNIVGRQSEVMLFTGRTSPRVNRRGAKVIWYTKKRFPSGKFARADVLE
ncbi:hypothetical protein G6F59_018855 [Rhizopus arrhizus]|nr:hypothetical protein G6F59_018855 [Rhizopus arrhizus]